MRSAILTNPHSNRNRRHLPRLRSQLTRLSDVRHIETASLDELPAAVGALLDDGVELLGINGGDGTVHLVLTALLRASAGRQLPAIALLPGGTTSMSARGLNGGAVPFDRALDALLDAIENARAGEPRHLLRVHAAGADPQLGLCLGMGAIVRGIQYCHERIFSLGLRDEWAAGVAMLRAGWGIARREYTRRDTNYAADGPSPDTFGESRWQRTGLLVRQRRPRQSVGGQNRGNRRSANHLRAGS